jgi:hypothetical protein
MKRVASIRLHCGVRDYLRWIRNVHTSLQRASEWGMGGLQGRFPCCKKLLPNDSEQQPLVLEAIVQVHFFDQRMLDTVRLRVNSTLNMFLLKTFTVITKLLNITSVPGNTIVRWTGVVMAVMTSN